MTRYFWKIINKTFILSFITLFFIVLGIKIHIYASPIWSYEWENTVIRIPVGDELSKYETIPVAYLCKDNKRLNDAKISYQRSGDWLYFLKDVDTNKVGTYYVWYKAYEYDNYSPGTCINYKCLITFIVEDLIPPKITVLADNIYFKRKKLQDSLSINDRLLSNVTAVDNYSYASITFNHNIDLTKNGKYPVFVYAVDKYGNASEDKFYATVYDENYPVITINYSNDIIKYNRNSDVDIKSYIVATDEIDGDISNNIIYPEFDLTTIGTKEYQISVTNSGGNTTTKTFRIEVVDDIAPSITLTSSTLTLSYDTDINNLNFFNYILKIEDDSEINYDNLVISHNLVNKVGLYYISYDYDDGINYANAVLDVRLISYKSPEIKYEDVTLYEGERTSLYGYVDVYDPSDSNIEESLVIDDSDVDYENEGIYYATIYAINTSGMSKTEKMKITINKKYNTTVIILIIVSVFLFLVVLTLGVIAYLYLKKEKKLKKQTK